MNKIIIAKEGFDALGETNPDNLIFSSDYNTLKYDVSGTDTYTITSGSTSGEHIIYTHNLGYVPFFVVFANQAPGFPTRYIALPYSFGDAFAYDHRFVYATTTEIIFRYENTGIVGDVNLTFAYKVFKNNLHLS